MSYLIQTTTGTPRQPIHRRIMANLLVKASWIDSATGEEVFAEGLTENIGESSALVNLQQLPPVGSEIQLQILDEENMLIEIPAEVIRLERDPSKPLAALSIVQNLKGWQQKVMTVAQDWVIRKWKLDYEEEWAN